jgi:hypothetical protein
LLGWQIIFNSSGTHHKKYLTAKQLILNGSSLSGIVQFCINLWSHFLCFKNQPIREKLEKYCFLIGWIFGKTKKDMSIQKSSQSESSIFPAFL